MSDRFLKSNVSVTSHPHVLRRPIIEIISENKERIAHMWKQRAVKRVSAIRQVPSQELSNSVFMFLNQLIDALSHDGSEQYIDSKTVAFVVQLNKHGSNNPGYELAEVVDEHLILRQVLFEILDDHYEVRPEERNIILNVFNTAIRNAATEFSNQRNILVRESDLKLKESEERFRIVVEGIKDHAIIRTDPEGLILDWSIGAEHIIGFKREEVLGKSASIIFTPDDLAKGSDKAEMQTARQDGKAEDNRWHLKKGGIRFYAMGIMNPLINHLGEVTGYVKVLRDNTAVMKDQLALKRSETRYRMATRATRNIIWEWDLVTDKTFWNEALETELGYTAENQDFGFDWWIEHIHPEDRDRIKINFNNFLKSGTDFWSDEYRFKKANGDYAIFRDRGYTLFDVFHKPIQMVGAMDDVTQERNWVSHFKQRSERFRSTFEHAAVGVAITDRELKFILVNKAYQNLLGFTQKELLHKTIADITHPDDALKHERELKQLIEKRRTSIVSEKRLLKKDGSLVWARNSVSPTRDSAGNITGLVDLSENVTAEKIAQEDLKKAKAEAETANASKSAFLANMSHEIRTPMTAVLGFIEVLRDPTLTEQERNDALIRIENSGRSLLKLIEDILDISKIEAGKHEVHNSPFSPLGVASDVISLMRLSAEKKGIVLKLKVDPKVPLTATSDAARIRQILLNLIGNGVKFTNAGEVVVHLKTEEDRYLIFEVCDTGIGISEKDQKKIFQPFVQADESITRKFGGTGLGLMLSKRLAERMGGDLWLEESHEQKGSRFIAKVDAGPFGYEPRIEPDNPLEYSQGGTQDEKPLEKYLILVAEDVPDNRILFKMYLEGAGARVEFAEDGAQAIEKAKAINFDLIFMDIQMPNIDGIQALKALRNDGYCKPIIALTAHAMSEEIQHSLASGFNAHLTKPLSRQTLVNAVRNFASRH